MNEWTRRLKDIGLTQELLAQRLGVSVQAVKKAFVAENSRYTGLIEALEEIERLGEPGTARAFVERGPTKVSDK